MIEIKMHGLAELERALKKLPEQIKRGGVIMRGLQAGADMVREEAKRRAPLLKDARFVVTKSGRRATRGYMGTARRRAGAIRDNIITQKRRGLRIVVRVRNRGYIFAKTSHTRSDRLKNPALAGNPNYWWLVEFGTSKTRAQPFMRPAFEAVKFQAAGVIRSAIAEEIRKAMADPAIYAQSQVGRRRRLPLAA